MQPDGHPDVRMMLLKVVDERGVVFFHKSYTRCPGPCIQNIAQLKKSLYDSNGNPTEFRVLLFSFDSTDAPSVLAEYRQRESVPLGWLIGTADQSNTDALLESIGFQVGKSGTEFMHPNMLLFLMGSCGSRNGSQEPTIPVAISTPP
jgi:cytochrome oxidase Cu insertion factor (SCO1/SenC/PrrC family)